MHTEDGNSMTSIVISDQQLVDYLLRVLPDKDHQLLAEQIENDRELQSRVSVWESVLFQLNTDTQPINPPDSVWQNIEGKLFAQSSETANKADKKMGGLARYLIPAFFSLLAIVAVNFYFAHQPNYGADVMAKNGTDVIWEISGNDDNMTFVSMSDMSMDGMDCVAWIAKEGQQMIKLGAIPDHGKQAKKHIKLPEGVHIKKGDKIVIYMLKDNYTESAPPANKAAMSTAVLTDI